MCFRISLSFFLKFLIKNVIVEFWKSRITGWRERQQSFIRWFHLLTSYNGQSWHSLKSGDLGLRWVQRIKWLGALLLLSQTLKKEARLEMKQSGFKVMVIQDASAAGSGFTHHGILLVTVLIYRFITITISRSFQTGNIFSNYIFKIQLLIRIE